MPAAAGQVWQHQAALHLDEGPFLSRAVFSSCHSAEFVWIQV